MEFIKAVVIVGIIIFLGVLIGETAFSHAPVYSPPIPLLDPTPTDIFIPTPTIDNCDFVTQYYYYCWDSGNPSPHHLGYRVFGDHYCTDRELGKCN